MSWVRHGDESDMNPRLMALAECEGFDSRTVNEVHGFISRCATYSASHLTDYIVELGVVVMYAGSEADRLVRMCLEVGLMEQVEIDGRQKLRIVEDETYVNIRSKEDVEWDRMQNNDARDPNIKGPVLLRDGDQCRYCGKEVYWSGKISNRRGVLDHLHPREKGTVDTMVVSCWSCNSARKKDESGEWSRAHPLLPVPERPRYRKWTRKYLEDRGLLFAAVPSSSAPVVAPLISPASVASSVEARPGEGRDSDAHGVGMARVDDAGVDLANPDGDRLVDPPCDSIRREDEVERSQQPARAPTSASAPGVVRDPPEWDVGRTTGRRLESDRAQYSPMGTPATGQSQGRVGTGQVGSGSGQVGSGRVRSGQVGSGSVRGRRRPRRRKRKR